MKVFTAAAALDAGAITPQTTFADQPRQETDGFVVKGFTIREHDLSPVQPALWALSPALQVSSNIFFAHVGLELGRAALPRLRAPLRVLQRPLDRVGPAHAAGLGELRHRRGGRRLRSVHRRRRAGQRRLRPGARRRSRRSRWPCWRRRSPTTASCRTRTWCATCAPTRRSPRPGRIDGSSRRPERRRRARGVRPTPAPDAQRHGRRGGGHARAALRRAGRRPALRHRRRVQTAGKTGTAERGEGQAPHSWFIGFAPAQGGATPSIAMAVHRRGRRVGLRPRRADRRARSMAEWLRLSRRLSAAGTRVNPSRNAGWGIVDGTRA